MGRVSFNIGGFEYPLHHVGGFRVTVPAKDPLAAPAVLQVTCSCHVYSERWDDDVHSPEHRLEEDGEVRAFCPVRYGCSIQLPDLIRYHVGGKAFKMRDRNGVWNHFFYAEADGIPYPIYFRLGRANQIRGADGILHVISAYQNADLRARHRYDSVKFARLVHQKCPPKPPK